MAPLGVVAIVGALVTVVAFDRRPCRSRRAVARFCLAMASWAALWFATASEFSRRAMASLPLHMVGHVIVMFLVPMGLIGSGAVRDWWWVVGAAPRRRVLRWWYLARRWQVPRWLANPVAATIVLNAVMVTSHTPRVFDYAMDHMWAMDWLMEPAFFVAGLFFFHYLIPSTPRAVRVRLRVQALMVVATMFEMVLLAMSMAIFTRAPWYHLTASSMAGMGGGGRPVVLSFHDQQVAAGILWICGDFWAVPILVAIARRLVARDGSLFAALDRQASGVSTSAV